MATVPEARSPNQSSDGGGSQKTRSAASQLSSGRSLTDEMLARFDSRAATYDRENRFFDQDFEELRAAKYLVMPVPEKFGGPGLSLAEVCREQRRLAYHAPATALAVNMHLYWVGVAADLWRRGDKSLEWMLSDCCRGNLRGRSRRERQRYPGLALFGESGTCRRRISLHRPQAVWQPDAGLDALRPPRNGHKRPYPSEGRPRVHAAR